MAKRRGALSSKRRGTRHSHKTKKRLAIKWAMLKARAVKKNK